MTSTTQAKTSTRERSMKEHALPAVSIHETREAYILEADLPGVNREGLEITIEGSELTLVGRRQPTALNAEVLLRERGLADYRRVFEIDPAINTTGITARLDQGLLRLTLPKAEAIKPRNIQIEE